MRRALGAGLILLAVQSLDAQTPTSCGREETISECFGRLADTRPSVRSPAVAAEAGGPLVRKLTGVGALGAGLASSIGDFLPLLSGAIGLTPTTTEKGGTGFETNLHVPFGPSLQTFQVRLTLEKPELFGPIRDALTAADRPGRITELERGLGDFDDVELGLTWNLETTSFGRSFTPVLPLATRLLRLQREAMTNNPEIRGMVRLRDELRDRTRPRGLTQFDPAMAGVEVGSKTCRPEDALNASQAWPIACYRAAWQDSVNRAAFERAIISNAIEARLDSLLTHSGFYRLGDLTSNQPQLSVEVARGLADRLIGPDRIRLGLRYEGGFTNINGFRRFARSSCGASTDVTITPDCLQRYLADPKVAASLERGDRFYLNVGFARRERYRALFAADSLSLALPGHSDLRIGAGLGRYLSFDPAGEPLGRLDLALEYVGTGDDALRDDRWIGAATYTYRLSESLSLAAGISYASKPEFLGEVDKKVGANFGLRYKLIRD